MLPLVVTVAAVTAGLVVPCLIDVARTPWYAFGRPSKETWLVIVAVLWVFGAMAWLLASRGRAGRAQPAGGRLSQHEALRRHPAWLSAEAGLGPAEAALTGAGSGPGSSGPIGPDDDPAFLLELHRRIHGTGEAS
jgi:hypothetical protein